MAILFSGDFHANKSIELNSIKEKTLLKRHGEELYGMIKYHIILGDAGFMWPGNDKKDLSNYEALACRPFPILCVQGEGEPFYGMKNLQETDIGIGETVYQINEKPFTAYLKRGKVYTIEGLKFLVLGGALSMNIEKRKNKGTWWEMEYWTEQEKLDLFKLLETENSFAYVLSHTGPHHINKLLFEHIYPDSEKFKDEVAFLNDEIHDKIQFCEWLCGHWHRDEYYRDKETDRGYDYFYRRTKALVSEGGNICIYDEKQYDFYKNYTAPAEGKKP
jgi:3-oxoacid CoA-transferase subunit A